MLLDRTTAEVKAKFLAALGLKSEYGNPSWPLPNLKPSTEKEFWGWRSSYSWRGEAWIGQIKVNDQWATVIVYFMDHSQFIGGGFAVAIYRQYREEKVEYFQWRSCDHAFVEKRTGNCQYRYTCSKCGEHFDVDSSG